MDKRLNNQVMNTKDALRAKFAEVFATIEGRRYSMLMCKDFEGKASISTQDVPRLGSVIMGKQATTAEISFSMTIYKCTEIFDDIVQTFINTGVMPTFTIQTSNDDPGSSVGRSTTIYTDCTLDGDVLLSMTSAEDDFIEQEISGFAGGYSKPEKFGNPAYM